MTELIASIVSRSIAASTPLLIGTLGEILAERAGVMNLGVEGMMAFGAVAGFAVALHTKSAWLGLLAAILAGALLALIHAILTVKLRANQVVSGLALTTLGLGLSGLIGRKLIGKPLQAKFSALDIPLLSDLPVVGKALFGHDILVYATLLATILLWFFLYRTKYGLAVRSAGENPLATETMSIDVVLLRILFVVIGGAFAGAAGGYLSLAYIPAWIEGMTAGRGWIVIALTMFSLWDPIRALAGSLLFGGLFVGQYFLQPYGISPNLLMMLPYLATLAALVQGATASKTRGRSAPASLGVPYERGER
ncbi:MAG TPA: ABC transporter permease [Candidatus Ozemobacteraceae bacterium]|nr:ABC transporter permease [Candidatus Ozemobacteraceae bacterium]HQG29740.1 ABC transporter permease [Candidatus Ozemobacteraceae bacterium]